MPGRDPLETVLRVAKLEWRADAIDRWRDRLDHELSEVNARVERLAKADEIADAVAEKVDGNRKLQLSWWQKAGAGLAAMLFAAAQIKGLV